MTTSNPFQPAAKVAKKLKILIYGASGVGKTLAALTFPRPAVIDTEGGTDLYAGRDGIPAFSVLRAKSLTDVETAIKFIQADNGKTFETLIIDAITVLYDVQKDAAGKAAKKEDEMTPRDWNKVNKRMVNLYNALTNLPVHVVVVAREAELYEGEGLNLKRVGFKADMDKKGVYIFDFIVRMKADRSGEVIKSRGVNIGKTVPAVNWDVFTQAAGMFLDGKQAQAIADDKAAELDARAYVDATPTLMPAAGPLRYDDESRFPRFLAWAKKTYGMSATDVDKALYMINNASFEESSPDEAMQACEAWHTAKKEAS
jgi:hypothetical protein